MGEYINLGVRTKYNFDSSIDVVKLMRYCKKNNIKEIGIADFQTLHHFVEVLEEAQKNDVNPVIGCEFKTVSEMNVKLYAKNMNGYKQIMKLSTKLKEKNNNSVTDDEILKMTNVVVVLNIKNLLIAKKITEINEILKKYSNADSLNVDDLYLQMQHYGMPKENLLNEKIATFSNKFGIKYVAINEVKYLTKKEAKVPKILEAIRNEKKFEAPKTSELYFKTSEELAELFKEKIALENTKEIAKKCRLVYPLKGQEGFVKKHALFQIPKEYKPSSIKGKFKVLEGYQKPKTKRQALAISYLCDLAWSGLEKQYEQTDEEAKERLKYELGVIIAKGFVDYFLMVADFVATAKKREIPLGPGRGSVAGSLLAKCLGITKLCPMEYNLLFERFLNPQREDDPDIDVDMSQKKRYKMIEYAIEKYGVNKVAQITTFNLFGPKLALRQVGKVMGISMKEREKLANMVDNSVVDLKNHKAALDEMIRKNSKVRETVEYASLIQGLPQNTSRHAAGIIISGVDLTEELPLDKYYDKEIGKEIYVIQIPNNNQQLEKAGFTKVDFLGSRNVDIIADTLELIEKNHQMKIKEIPLNDEKTYRLYQKGKLIGTFQMDSPGMRQASKEIKPENLHDIMSVIALYRPGPMEMIPKYSSNKRENETSIYDENGGKINGVSGLEQILKDTFGIIIYQEQINQIAHQWANYKLGEADLLRRAISKKKKEILEKEQEKFVNKSIEIGREKEITEKIYQLIVKFADYGFNRAHSAVYALMSYQTAWLKVNYPKEYMSVLISSVLKDTSKAAKYVQEAKRSGVKVYLPDINASKGEFVSLKNGILFGLGMIKHVSPQVGNQISKIRGNIPFKNFDDFLKRVSSHSIDKRAIESLIKIGAFDKLNSNRNQLLEVLKTSKKKNNINFEQQLSFVDVPGINYDKEVEVYLPEAVEFSLEEKLQNEYNLSCMYITELPYEKEMDLFEMQLNFKNRRENTDSIWIWIFITFWKEEVDRNGNRYAVITAMTEEGEKKFYLFNQNYEKNKENLKNLTPYLIRVDKKWDKSNVVQEIEKKDDLRILIVQVDEMLKGKSKEETSQWMKKLASLINANPGEQKIILKTSNKKKEYKIKLEHSVIKKILSIIEKDNLFLI